MLNQGPLLKLAIKKHMTYVKNGEEYEESIDYEGHNIRKGRKSEGHLNLN